MKLQAGGSRRDRKDSPDDLKNKENIHYTRQKSQIAGCLEMVNLLRSSDIFGSVLWRLT